ncbi:PREDICTED: uncharacterized protein LOC107344918 [Acropora digitifera]|uniref:uncharacterized protein LOC107344918 n=1 Tax=Acropora digitifera TaxID=70779 RepID=UPI00077ABBE3|nr:PREDICTED: uncharacterized protein LOC107344918 [Acropora digitifera]
MMDSKQPSKCCINEMGPLTGTSKEAPIHEVTSKTEQPPADPNLVPVKFCVKLSQKACICICLLTTLVIVVIVAVPVAIFVSKNIKNKDKEKIQEDNVEQTVSVNLTSSLSSQTQLAASLSIFTSSNELPTVSACSTCSKISVSHEDISSPATTLPTLSSTMQPPPNTENNVKVTSTLSSKDQLAASTSILTSLIELRTTSSACSTCNGIRSRYRGNTSSPAAISSP